jgi:short subunit dehydrogenase-like uncharacterized protein
LDRKVKYDLVVYGATVFTGRLVVDYIIRKYGIINKEFTWAIAGRDKDTLIGIVSLVKILGVLQQKSIILVGKTTDYDSCAPTS